MSAEADKLKATLVAAPVGALIGGVTGYFISKKVGYDKTISVISFTMVGVILGSVIGVAIGKKINT